MRFIISIPRWNVVFICDIGILLLFYFNDYGYRRCSHNMAVHHGMLHAMKCFAPTNTTRLRNVRMRCS